MSNIEEVALEEVVFEEEGCRMSGVVTEGRVRFGRMCSLGVGIRVFHGWRLRWLILLLVVLQKERRWRRYEFGGLAIGVGRLRGLMSWKSLENVKMMIVVRIGAAMKFARLSHGNCDTLLKSQYI
jgi:hypothetical protein